MKDLYQVGYVFGKALCAENIDPLYYLEWIRTAELDLPFDQDRLLGQGASQAVREMPADQLVANVEALISQRWKGDAEGGATPHGDLQKDTAFNLGAQSVVVPAMYAVQSHSFEGWPDFERGVEVGKKIRAAWDKAIAVA